MLVERQEFFVPLGPPREGIDAIKSLDVIDPKQMKDSSSTADPFAPPLEIVRAHHTPAIKRNAPVLSPFLSERVVLEEGLGRRAPEPVEHEFIRAREDIRAVVTDAEGNVAHQRHSALLRVRFDVSPLLISDPLHVTEEVSAPTEGCLFIVREIAYPVPGIFSALMLGRPSIPCGATVIFLDENAEERVIVQP